MDRPKTTPSGFSVLEALLVVLAIVILSGVSVVVYQHNRVKLSSAAPNNNQTVTKPTTTQPTNASATYTSTAGNFSFTYPAGWQVIEQPPTPGVLTDDLLYITPPAPAASQSTVGRATYKDRFSMTLIISTNPDSRGHTTAADHPVQKLPNGISLWTSSEAQTGTRTSPTGATYVCPELAIISDAGTHFSYNLRNGKFLSLSAGYCEAESDTTTLSYQQQLGSSDWQAAISIMQSIQFK